MAFALDMALNLPLDARACKSGHNLPGGCGTHITLLLSLRHFICGCDCKTCRSGVSCGVVVVPFPRVRLISNGSIRQNIPRPKWIESGFAMVNLIMESQIIPSCSNFSEAASTVH